MESMLLAVVSLPSLEPSTGSCVSSVKVLIISDGKSREKNTHPIENFDLN
jgi:hypothetical protein